jgi:hypothetical protein
MCNSPKQDPSFVEMIAAVLLILHFALEEMAVKVEQQNLILTLFSEIENKV